jgi:hypothetical protein
MALTFFHVSVTCREDYLTRRRPIHDAHRAQLDGWRAGGHLVALGLARPTARRPTSSGGPGTPRRSRAAKIAFGGCREAGETLALALTPDAERARRWLAATRVWASDRLSTRPFFYVL